MIARNKRDAMKKVAYILEKTKVRITSELINAHDMPPFQG